VVQGRRCYREPDPRSATAAPSNPEEDRPGRESVDQVVVVLTVTRAKAPPSRLKAGAVIARTRTGRLIDMTPLEWCV
jgi:hypothetical protein